MAASSSKDLIEAMERLEARIQENEALRCSSQALLERVQLQFSQKLRTLFGCQKEEVLSSIQETAPYVYEELIEDPLGFLKHQLSIEQNNRIDQAVAETLRQHLSEWEKKSVSGLSLVINKPCQQEIASVKRRRSRIKI